MHLVIYVKNALRYPDSGNIVLRLHLVADLLYSMTEILWHMAGPYPLLLRFISCLYNRAISALLKRPTGAAC